MTLKTAIKIARGDSVGYCRTEPIVVGLLLREIETLRPALELERTENLKLGLRPSQFDLEGFVTRQAYRLQEILGREGSEEINARIG